VVRDADSITVVNSAGERTGALLEISKPSVDLAMITVPNVMVRNWASFDTDSDWERIGEKVYVYGNPKEMEGTFSEGMLSAWRVNGVFMQISAPTDDGSSGSPVFNRYGLVIGIVREKLESSAQLNFAISSNAIYEALELKTSDHPDGFNQGISKGLEMRTPGEIAADAKLVAQEQPVITPEKAKLRAYDDELQKTWDALPASTQAELQELKTEWGIEKATGELKLQRILDLTAYLLGQS
jgi:S1-C subfamily serine protease